MAERQGVQIDYCPSCRGIWLDHGELEKILQYEMKRNSRDHMQEQLDPLMPPPTMDRQRQEDREQRYRGDDHDDYDYRYGRGGRRGRRRDGDNEGGFFGQIMDIFD